MIPPIDPSQIQMATQAPNAPPGPAAINALHAPGLLSRLGGLFKSPFQIDPGIADFLSPEQQHYLKSRQQMELASRLLQASGPAPQGTQSFGSRLGGAMSGAGQNWNEMQQQAVQQGFQRWQMERQQSMWEGRQKFLSQNPLKANASKDDVGQWMAKAIPFFTSIGDYETVKALSEGYKAINPQDWTVVQGVGPDGRPIFERINAANGQIGGVGGGAPGGGAPSGGAGGSPLTPGATVQQDIDNESKLRNEYQGATKEFQTRAAMYRDALQFAPEARTGKNAIAQANLIAAAASAMSGGVQGSGRGEALLGLIEKSKPLYGKIQSFLAGPAGKAQLLTPTEVDELSGLLRQRHNSTIQQWQKVFKGYQGQAGRSRVNPKAVFPVPDDSLPEGSTGSSAVDAVRAQLQRYK